MLVRARRLEKSKNIRFVDIRFVDKSFCRVNFLILKGGALRLK
jgi:hypothetical protein